MWTADRNFPAKGFSTPPPSWNSKCQLPVMPCSERKRISPRPEAAHLFHVIHKVPAGDSPYVRAKHVQLVDKDPSKAISMFWAAINSGDRVDSALKDMAVVMKQLNRSEEAIEAIKSFRHLCPDESQESLDNLLLELYKRSGRVEEQIEMLQVKLKLIEEGMSFGGKRTKAARSQGKKILITVEQEYSRLLGNLAWAYLQLNHYKLAEELYRKALSLEHDKNKQCNLAICLMHMNKLTEAKFLLQTIRSSCGDEQIDEAYAKSYERAVEMMSELEPKQAVKKSQKRAEYDHASSPASTGTMPKVPYTQPRRSSWSLNSGDKNRGWVQEDSAAGCKQPKSGQNENNAPSINGSWRKPELRNYDEMRKTEIISQRCEEKKDFLICESKKKSWADMVEEDEQEELTSGGSYFFGQNFTTPSQETLFFGDIPCYRDEYANENVDSNIISQTPSPKNQNQIGEWNQNQNQIEEWNQNQNQIESSVGLKDGYCTQPQFNDSKINNDSAQGARRSLCFDQLEKKSLNFEGCDSNSLLSQEISGNDNSKPRTTKRLPVFENLTLL